MLRKLELLRLEKTKQNVVLQMRVKTQTCPPPKQTKNAKQKPQNKQTKNQPQTTKPKPKSNPKQPKN